MLVGLLTLVGMYYGEYYIIGGFHPGWYGGFGYAYLLTIPIVIGFAILFVQDQKYLERLTVIGALILIIVAFEYRHGSLVTPWREIGFTLYHLTMTWFAALTFCWTRHWTRPQ